MMLTPSSSGSIPEAAIPFDYAFIEADDCPEDEPRAPVPRLAIDALESWDRTLTGLEDRKHLANKFLEACTEIYRLAKYDSLLPESRQQLGDDLYELGTRHGLGDDVVQRLMSAGAAAGMPVSHDTIDERAPPEWRDEWSSPPPAAKPVFVMYADLQATETKTWLVHKLLGAGELSAFYGAPGCGKGVIIEDMGLHIAAARTWHGRAVQAGAVVYIALERKKLVERRAIAFRNKHGLKDLPFAIVGGIYDFRNPATANQIADICRMVEKRTGQPVVLVIVDTLSRGLCGGDENSPKDMGAIVTTSALIQEETGAHLAWVHHMPHEAERMRGHGALLGAVDTTINITKGTVRTAKVVKANDSEEGETISFVIESIEIAPDGTTAPIAAPVVTQTITRDPKLSPDQQTMLRLLHEAGPAGLSTADWNEVSRNQGIGVRRKATLNDIQAKLKDLKLVREYNGIWHVSRS